MKLSKANKILYEKYKGAVKAELIDDCIYVSGSLDNWNDIVEACSICATKYSKIHVVNDINFTGGTIPETRKPTVVDSSLEGKKCDVLIIGGGISGASIARELTRWNLSILLVDKESDLAMHASSRNDGQVHPGVDLNNGNLKHEYVLKGNHIYDEVCKELDVPFKRVGQYGAVEEKGYRFVVTAYALYKKYFVHVSDTKIINKKKLYSLDPNFEKGYTYGLYNPSSGVVSPYGLTIAYGENAIQNGAEISLQTYVESMCVEDGEIKSVKTNRGTIYPKLVISAAGVFAEDIAKMANDRFFSIHPRKGTNSILDKKAGKLINGIISVKSMKTYGKSNTKGGGILHTIHDNLLLGPDAIETYKKEDFSTEQSSINTVFNAQEKATKVISQQDIITYFTGVRAPTFEEDFILERGRKTKNIIHVAGIQSPGLTAAPAFAKDISKLAVDILSENFDVKINESFNPIRKGIPHLKDMPLEERDALIKTNPDYGIIVCRCEEISKGEIIDALKSPLCVPTVDGIKKRVRPGMGRCQGGFCMPQVIKIISEYLNISEEDVVKTSDKSFISYGKTK